MDCLPAQSVVLVEKWLLVEAQLYLNWPLKAISRPAELNYSETFK